jgi:hypothetical protein
MSSSDVLDSDTTAIARTKAALQAALDDPDRVSDDELRELVAGVVKLYAARADAGMRRALPADGGGVSITDAMLTITDLMNALNVQLFELSMWQAMSGNCIAPQHRVNAPESN